MNQEEQDRLNRLASIREAGIDPYPAKSTRTHEVRGFLSDFQKLEASGDSVTLVGRIRLLRKHGGLTFLQLQDETGMTQLALKRDEVGEDVYKQFHAHLDVADFIEVQGNAFTTKKGEPTLNIQTHKLLTKTILPLPEKWHGVSDVETRFRKRYLDLIMNEEVRVRMQQRSRIITSIRELLDGKGFMEVETPTLQPIYGGGYAKPFVTHHNSLDADFYLRISDEMYLKRLLVGGFEKVYEITKVFRNEGIDRDHNPEFTMFEAQIAYENVEYGMDIFEEIFENAAKKANDGSTQIQHEEVLVDVQRPWKRMRMIDAVAEIGGLPTETWEDLESARKVLLEKLPTKAHEEANRILTVGELLAFAFEELVEEALIQPTIIYDYPVEISPLAKRSSDPRFVERFEAFALGSEIGNNYSELNDPIDLEQRFMEEKNRETAGFDEAHQTDYAYLDAIKHGMPPACGLGIGVDRMVMLLTGAKNIKEVILFPTLRPEQRD